MVDYKLPDGERLAKIRHMHRNCAGDKRCQVAFLLRLLDASKQQAVTESEDK